MTPRSEPYQIQVPQSQTPSHEEEESRDGPTVPGARPTLGSSHAPTSPRTVRRFPFGPCSLDYDDAERKHRKNALGCSKAT